MIKFRMDNEGGNGAGCFKVEIRADTAKFTKKYENPSIFVKVTAKKSVVPFLCEHSVLCLRPV